MNAVSTTRSATANRPTKRFDNNISVKPRGNDTAAA